jgi:hypothetical protein
VPVTGYALPGVRAALEGRECGVRVDLAAAEDCWAVAAVGMAGIAGECLEYGCSEGGVADMQEVCGLVRGREPEGGEAAARRVARWGLLQAALLLTQHAEAHRRLAEAMREGRSVEECFGVIERWCEWDDAAEGGAEEAARRNCV